jgi:ATP-dependent helicase/nuclease subunit A
MRHLVEAARTGSSSLDSVSANKQETASASHSVPRDVAEKVRSFMRQFAKWRRLARRSSTEEVLRQLFADTAFLEYIAGMRGGEIRTANIEALMDRARAFDRASSDGVFGFVRQAKQHIELEIDHGEAATLGENADVVRIMTIHQSKGLEFPVVFVADLGKQFFQSHEEKSFLLHRRLGFGPQFYDMDTHRRWKTLPSLAIEQVERQETLAEEARVLYVALTRAREKLILVGSGSKLPQVLARHARAFHPAEYALPISTLLRAKSYLDWVIPAVMRHVDGRVLWSVVDSGEAPEVRDDVMRHHPVRIGVRLYQLPGFDEVPVPASASNEPVTSFKWNGLDSLAEQLRQAEAQGDADGCPQRQGVMGDAESDATSNIGVSTPPLVQMTLPNAPSKVSATDLRRLWVARINGGRNVESIRSRNAAEQLLDVPAFVERTSLSGKESGTAFHTVMQHIDFKMDATIEAVTERIEQLHQMGLLSDEQRQAVDVEDVIAFLRSPLASRLKDAEYVLREQNFFHRIVLAGSSRNDAYVIVQGVIDCLAKVGETHWLLIDYKTDRIKAEEAQDKAREYSAQIAAYIDVLMATHPGHQVEAYVYFVKPRVALPMQSVPLHQVFE